ncbi:hypothetical protein F6I18_04130 [Corynebacterium amycolatum]|nr:hypothetical protein F6I18_04130 [Corynebacterium amycolatum]
MCGFGADLRIVDKRFALRKDAVGLLSHIFGLLFTILEDLVDFLAALADTLCAIGGPLILIRTVLRGFIAAFLGGVGGIAFQTAPIESHSNSYRGGYQPHGVGELG